ncbi:MAG TPA: hypothetical protein V6D34_19085 [Candidatus Sericytochromatia bacterium]|jgi:hypothetical protein
MWHVTYQDLQILTKAMTPDLKAIELASVAALVYELRQRVGLS